MIVCLDLLKDYNRLEGFLMSVLKGHWTTSASSLKFFKKVEIFIPVDVFSCVMTHAQSYLQLQLSYKDILIVLLAAIFKSRLLKMAASVMTVEFGTNHHTSKSG